jgi:hypothetical protein
MRHRSICASLVSLLLAASACGDDGDATTTTRSDPPPTTATTDDATTDTATTETTAPADTATGIDPADAEYCAAVERINSSDSMPTVDEVRAYLEVAPDEVQAPGQVVIDALEASGGDFTAVFADEAAGAALEQITAIEAERCGTGDDGPPQDPMVTVVDEAATRVDVVATEYAFDATMPTTPGRYSFVMSNGGAEPHLMVLLRLADGATLDDVLTTQGEEGVAEQYESSPATPGGEGVLSVDLVAGRWVLLCPIPGPTGTPHFADGMLREFTI